MLSRLAGSIFQEVIVYLFDVSLSPGGKNYLVNKLVKLVSNLNGTHKLKFIGPLHKVNAFDGKRNPL